ncbi:energy transducer TonB [Spiribacter halobius]|uniref:TonB C-terminal domain-containing protein n=1 Tax=Sediminicurvatus halobius TaxID=2182432 RepID=A0A2U2N2R3_9GAMM|nr:energy transducer TonB [Spiribacter halobius]PWG63274.1 hypothetical protein DEM34_09375 [Spiribacter halobius]UEX76652.1 energy transducer TonB [Spiribacter halobius]
MPTEPAPPVAGDGITQRAALAATPEKRVTARGLSEGGSRRDSGEERAARQSAAETYLRQLREHLAEHREYPQEARAKGAEGTVILALVIGRGGEVLSARIDRSSGYADLDGEVHAMIHRASPLPPMPEALAQERLSLRIPVRFRLEDR